MHPLIMVPALGCGAGLYERMTARLPEPSACRAVTASASTMIDCARQISSEAPQSFLVLGTSFGGAVAAQVAVTSPERIQGLVIIGSWPGAAADPAAGMRRAARLRGSEFEAVVSEMAAMVAHADGPRGLQTQADFKTMARIHGAEFMARQSEAMAHRPDLLPKLAALHCPALLIWGEHDKFVPAADGRKLAAMIPGSRYAELPDCGHFPSLEYPEETAQIVEHWLIDHGLT